MLLTYLLRRIFNVFGIVLVAGVLLCQAQTGDAKFQLRGKVLDQNGAAIAGAKVTAAAKGRTGGISTISDENGEFALENTSAENLEIKVAAEGFAPFSAFFKTGDIIDIKLAPRGFDEFLTVVGADETYRASSATTAMRADIPLRDTPQSIQVIT